MTKKFISSMEIALALVVLAGHLEEQFFQRVQAAQGMAGDGIREARPQHHKLVLALDSHSTEAAIGLTNIYMKSGRLSDAEPLLRRLATERPDDAGIHLQLGRVLSAQGKKDDAIRLFRLAAASCPKGFVEFDGANAELKALGAAP